MSISFTNSTTPDSAVAYTDPTALCGSTATATQMENASNAANFKLPLNAPGCTQRIGMTWVAAVTNLLAFVIDRAGLEFAPNTACDDPLLLYKAMVQIIQQNTQKIIINPILYIRTDGSDTNDGLSNNAGGAFRTIEAALTAATSQYNFLSSTLTLQLGNPGSYTLPRHVGFVPGTIAIVGDATNQQNYILGASATDLMLESMAQNLIFRGVTIANPGIGSSLVCDSGVITIQNVSFIVTASSNTITNGAHLQSNGSGATIKILDGCTFSGNASCLFYSNGGTINAGNLPGNPLITITLLGNPTFTIATIYIVPLSEVVLLSQLAFSGTANAPQWNVDFLAFLSTVSRSGGSFIPGTSSGNVNNGHIS